MKGLVGSIMGYFYESGFCFGLARRASQNTKDEIKYPSTGLIKPSYKRFIIQLEGYKISSVNVGSSTYNENALHTNGTPLKVQFSLYATLLLIGWK